jgi:hypothetical protein
MSKRAAFQRMLTRIRDTDDIDHVIGLTTRSSWPTCGSAASR